MILAKRETIHLRDNSFSKQPEYNIHQSSFPGFLKRNYVRKAIALALALASSSACSNTGQNEIAKPAPQATGQPDAGQPKPKPDRDRDGIPDDEDPCPRPDRRDSEGKPFNMDGDRHTDACEPRGCERIADDGAPGHDHSDLDRDLVCAAADNAPGNYNPLQLDSDRDGVGERPGGGESPGFDNCPGVPNPRVDTNGDGVPDIQPDADGDGHGAACDPNDNDRTIPGREVCDGMDNDLDGITDMPGCACKPGATREVGPPQVGRCRSTTEICVADGPLASHFESALGSLPARFPILETCNGEDDDCDGATDNGDDPNGNPCECVFGTDADHDGTTVVCDCNDNNAASIYQPLIFHAMGLIVIAIRLENLLRVTLMARFLFSENRSANVNLARIVQ